MAHRRAKLTPFGRLLLVQRVEEMGWTVARAAEAVGVSRSTDGKRLRRYRGEGLAGLGERAHLPAKFGLSVTVAKLPLSRLPDIFDADGALGAVGHCESGFLLHLRWHNTVTNFVRIAVVVKLEQLSRRYEAAVVPLALLAIDLGAHHGNTTGMERGPRT